MAINRVSRISMVKGCASRGHGSVNAEVTEAEEAACLAALAAMAWPRGHHVVSVPAHSRSRCPGQLAETGRSSLIALGAVIRVRPITRSGLQRVCAGSSVSLSPPASGQWHLTTEDDAQAMPAQKKKSDCAMAAIEMANLLLPSMTDGWFRR